MRDFSRHIPIIGEDGQRVLMNSTVGIVGAGALGSHMAVMLHRVGIGKIIVVDRDMVEPPDLPRTVYREEDIGKPKAVALAEFIGETVEPHVDDFNPSTLDILEGVDIVLDGTDNLLTRYVINDFCVREGIPWVYAGVLRTGGAVMPVIPGKTACFRCYLPAPPSTPPPTCAVAGVMSYVPSLAASIAVSLAVRVLLGEEVGGEIIYFDLSPVKFSTVEVPRRADCPCCVHGKYEFLSGGLRVEEMCDSTIQIVPPVRMRVDLAYMEERLRAAGHDVLRTEHYIRFREGDAIITIFATGRMLIKGAENTGVAKNLYARYMG